MSNVLIVDDERSFLETLTDRYSGFLEGFRVLTAGNGVEAIRVLESEKVELVVTDLKMPEMGGFELIAYLTANASEMPVVVMSAYASEEDEEELRRLGLRFIAKPIDPKKLSAAIREELDSRSHGFLRGFSLPAFLQLLEMERKSCTLKVASGNRTGYLFFKDGTLFSAATAMAAGDEAVMDILQWENAHLQLSAPESRDADVQGPLSYLLLNAAKAADEKQSAASEAKAVPAAAAPPAPPAVEPAGGEEDWLVTGSRSVFDFDEEPDISAVLDRGQPKESDETDDDELGFDAFYDKKK